MKINFTQCANMRRLIKSVCKKAVEVLSQPESIEINVSFFSVGKMRELNCNSRGIDAPTDVLSFPSLNVKAGRIISEKQFPDDVNPENGCLILGEIVICSKIAKEQAVEFGHSLEREYAFLFLHGFLHLLGYDHIKKSDSRVMEELQDKILDELDIKR